MAAGRYRTSSWGPPAMASSWAFTRGSWPTSARTPESRCCCRCSPGRCHRACTPSRQSITRRIAWSPTRRKSGDRHQLGIGLSIYVEVTAMGIGPEWGAVHIETDGTATVRCGTTSFGQGHETSLAQIAAEELGMPMEAVRVIHSDTDAIERGTGTVGSRSMQHGGSAVHQAAQQVRHKARDLASHLLEADPADIVSG